jgi:hypothetical protein
MPKWRVRDITFTTSKTGSGKKEKYLLVVERGNLSEDEWTRLKGYLDAQYDEDESVSGDKQWSVTFRSEGLDTDDLTVAVCEAVSNSYPNEYKHEIPLPVHLG